MPAWCRLTTAALTEKFERLLQALSYATSYGIQRLIVRNERSEAEPNLRDVLTMNQHLMGSLRTYEMAGRLLLGLEPLRWLF